MSKNTTKAKKPRICLRSTFDTGHPRSSAARSPFGTGTDESTISDRPSMGAHNPLKLQKKYPIFSMFAPKEIGKRKSMNAQSTAQSGYPLLPLSNSVPMQTTNQLIRKPMGTNNDARRGDRKYLILDSVFTAILRGIKKHNVIVKINTKLAKRLHDQILRK